MTQGQYQKAGTVPIKVFEDHDEAYRIWKRLGLRGKILVHLDAHFDFGVFRMRSLKENFAAATSKNDLVRRAQLNVLWKARGVDLEKQLNIGNYIFPAIRDGIVNRFYWIIPGNQKNLGDSLNELQRRMSCQERRGVLCNMRIKKDSLVAEILGCPFIATTIDKLSENMRDVLLDIDTDYLTIKSISEARVTQKIARRFPWVWPDECFDILRDKGVTPACVTIAYSVNGGFTPMIYKILGDELAALATGRNERQIHEWLDDQKKALNLFYRGRYQESVDMLKGMLDKLEGMKISKDLKKKIRAHVCFVLFRNFAVLEKLSQAKKFYHEAIGDDSEYRVKDNNYGPLYLHSKRLLKKAADEFQLILTVDPNNAAALGGKGQIYFQRKEYKDAERYLKKSIASDGKQSHILLLLSQTEAALGKDREVIRYAQQGLELKKNPSAFLLLLAHAYKNLNMNKKALKLYRRIYKAGYNITALIEGVVSIFREISVPENYRSWINSLHRLYEINKQNFQRSSVETGKRGQKLHKRQEKFYIKHDRLWKKIMAKEGLDGQ